MGVDAVRLMGRDLCFTAVQQQRRSGHHATKANVGDVAHAVERHQAQPVGAGRPGAFRCIHHHAAGDAAGVETQLQQQRQKQLVEFIAIAAAPLFEHFSLDRFKVDGHGLTQQRRQGFKREFGSMAPLQLTQRVEGRRWRGIETQAPQIASRIAQLGMTHEGCPFPGSAQRSRQAHCYWAPGIRHSPHRDNNRPGCLARSPPLA
ncbi:hypothetical protein D3C76_1019200 [compost metagenome]